MVLSMVSDEESLDDVGHLLVPVRPRQVSRRGDRIAILTPRGVDHVVVFPAAV